MWWKFYETLHLYGGIANYIFDDFEDMIEISYPDGMLVDVGKSDDDGNYYITVVSSDDEKGWQKPLEIISVADKKDLYGKIQDAIEKYRKQQR